MKSHWQGTPQQLISKVSKLLKSPPPEKDNFQDLFDHHHNKKHAEIVLSWAEECINGKCNTVSLIEKDGQHFLTVNFPQHIA